MAILDLVARLVERFVDRAKVSAQVTVRAETLTILVSNLGKEPSSINAVGLWTTEGDKPLRVTPPLPVSVAGRSEVLLYAHDMTGLGVQGLTLRYRGHEITGIWLRTLGGGRVNARISPADLHRLNGGDEGAFTIGR